MTTTSSTTSRRRSATGDTSLVINTANPSTDDNLFLAVISITAQAAVTTEICNDGIDNDGDGLVDLADPDCVIPSTFDLDLTPATATNPVDTEHTVTATLTDNGSPVDAAPIGFTVDGVNPTTGTATTNACGVATFTYTGNNPGDDTITACYEQTDTPPCEALASATKTWTPVDTGGPTVTESSEPPTVTAGNNVLQTFTVTNTSDVTRDERLARGHVPGRRDGALEHPGAGDLHRRSGHVDLLAGHDPGGWERDDPGGRAGAGGLPAGDVRTDGDGHVGPDAVPTRPARCRVRRWWRPRVARPSASSRRAGRSPPVDATPANPTGGELHAAEHRLGCADLAHDRGRPRRRSAATSRAGASC